MPFATAKPAILPPHFTFTQPVLQAVLPTDVAALTALLHQQHAAHMASVDSLAQQVRDYANRVIEQMVLARHRQFGVSSEQLSGQGRLFDEAEALAQSSTEEQDIAPIAPETVAGADKKVVARGKRSPLPAVLARFDVVHDVPAAERTCPCGTPMVEIGQDVSEQLDIVPMQVRVLRHIRKRYGCPESMHAPVTAPLPPQPLPKSNASADFLSMLLIIKFIDGLPLARFEHVLARHGATVPRQTLARWVIAAARMLQPLHNLMRDALFDGAFLHIDKTVVQVLKEDGKTPTSTSYMWVQTGGPPGKPVTIYDYDPSRSGAVPVRLLQGYKGYMMTDGYTAYNELAKEDGIEHLICWAHARRRFVEAVRVQPKGKRGRADEAVAWMEKNLPLVTPKSALGTALAYMQRYWHGLSRYTERGDLPIDNNRVENAIRPFVVGRKSWLFADTAAGAHASAVVYSLVQTAKANGLEPYAWLRRVMRDLPKATTVEDVEALLPWNVDLTQNILHAGAMLATESAMGVV